MLDCSRSSSRFSTLPRRAETDAPLPAVAPCAAGLPLQREVSMLPRGLQGIRGVSFDHLVGTEQKGRWHLDADRPGSLQINNELEVRGRLHRQIAGAFSLQYPVNITRGPAKLVYPISP